MVVLRRTHWHVSVLGIQHEQRGEINISHERKKETEMSIYKAFHYVNSIILQGVKFR